MDRPTALFALNLQTHAAKKVSAALQGILLDMVPAADAVGGNVKATLGIVERVREAQNDIHIALIELVDWTQQEMEG